MDVPVLPQKILARSPVKYATLYICDIPGGILQRSVDVCFIPLDKYLTGQVKPENDK